LKNVPKVCYTVARRIDTMGRLKNREMYSTSIDKELLAQLKKLSEETRIPQSRLMDEAIEDLLKKHGKKEG